MFVINVYLQSRVYICNNILSANGRQHNFQKTLHLSLVLCGIRWVLNTSIWVSHIGWDEERRWRRRVEEWQREREKTLAVKGHEPLGSGFIDPRKPDGETKREMKIAGSVSVGDWVREKSMREERERLSSKKERTLVVFEQQENEEYGNKAKN